MHIIKEQISLYGTYFLTITGITLNLENIKGGILFIGALILVILQIRLHLIKIRKEHCEAEISEMEKNKLKEDKTKNKKIL